MRFWWGEGREAKRQEIPPISAHNRSGLAPPVDFIRSSSQLLRSSTPIASSKLLLKCLNIKTPGGWIEILSLSHRVRRLIISTVAPPGEVVRSQGPYATTSNAFVTQLNGFDAILQRVQRASAYLRSLVKFRRRTCLCGCCKAA
jgi:hypothetical protein